MSQSSPKRTSRRLAVSLFNVTQFVSVLAEYITTTSSPAPSPSAGEIRNIWSCWFLFALENKSAKIYNNYCTIFKGIFVFYREFLQRLKYYLVFFFFQNIAYLNHINYKKIYLWKYLYCTFIEILFVKKANVTIPTHKSKFHCFMEMFLHRESSILP